MSCLFALDEQLQFIFRHIDHKDPDKPYVFTLSINEQGDYEGMWILSSYIWGQNLVCIYEKREKQL